MYTFRSLAWEDVVMTKKWGYALQIVLSLLMVMGLAIGCAMPSSTSTPGSTPTPPASEYPADISGHVTIAEKVKCATAIAVSPNRGGDIFWIVDISVKNKAYENPVEASFEMGYKGWVIRANDKVYRPRACGSRTDNPPLSLTLGQTGQFMLHFSMPQTLQPTDAQICYQGQEPYAYGELSGGDKVAAYDWDLKKAVQEKEDLGELYVVPDEDFRTSNKRLRTVARWTGTESKVIKFSIEKSPWVINGGYEVVSSLGHNFSYFVFTEDEYSVPEEALQKYWQHELLLPTRVLSPDNLHGIVKQSGKFAICVYASGVKWQLKVGVE